LRFNSFLVSLLVALAASDQAIAAEPVWPTTTYDYVVVEQDLRTVLTQFGTNTGLRVIVSDAVQGRVRGPLPSAPPREFLDNLTRTFGLDWYFDGAAISVSAASEAQSHLLPLQGVSFAKLRAGLATAGLLDPRYQVRPAVGSDIAMVSGPPRFVSIVQQATTALASEKVVKHEPELQKLVVVFRGSSVSRLQFP